MSFFRNHCPDFTKYLKGWVLVLFSMITISPSNRFPNMLLPLKFHWHSQSLWALLLGPVRRDELNYSLTLYLYGINFFFRYAFTRKPCLQRMWLRFMTAMHEGRGRWSGPQRVIWPADYKKMCAHLSKTGFYTDISFNDVLVKLMLHC